MRVTEKDNVTIFLYPHSTTLAEDIAVECFKNGADVLLNLYTDRYHRAYLKDLPVESLRQPSVFCRALTESSTVEIFLSGAYDPAIFRDIPPERSSAAAEGESKAHFPLSQERKVRSLGSRLSLLTRPRAKAYGFDYARWTRMVRAAANVDYSELASTGKRLKRMLAGAETLKVTASNGTDLTLLPGGRWRVFDGVIDDDDMREGDFDDGIPAGNVGTVFVEGADGVVTFDTTTPHRGRPVRRMTWRFKNGSVTEFSGDSSTRPVVDDWEHSSGDKNKISFVSIGYNPKARPNFTINEIVAGAISIGIGDNQVFGGKNVSGFSFVHTLTEPTITADGRVIVKCGRLV